MPDQRRVYGEVPNLSAREIQAAVDSGELAELRVAVLSAALGSLDQVAAEALCQDFASHADAAVRASAVLGLGHIARIHRILDEGRSRPLIEAALRDPDEGVRGQADSAADDVELFLGWKLRRPGAA